LDKRIADMLRTVGLRATAPRMAILQALTEDRRHPTAEMLYESLRGGHPSLSLSTVYHTLEIFIQRGLVRRITNAGGRLRVDGTVQDHDHAVCRSCGEVFDVDPRLVQRPSVPPVLPNGLKVRNLHLEYEVTCTRCTTQSEPPAESP
jgi:Fe2+ or Zn2+ uptake regulation protein